MEECQDRGHKVIIAGLIILWLFLIADITLLCVHNNLMTLTVKIWIVIRTLPLMMVTLGVIS